VGSWVRSSKHPGGGISGLGFGMFRQLLMRSLTASPDVCFRHGCNRHWLLVSRYSVDELWHVPHFEKMTYDNPQVGVQLVRSQRNTSMAWQCLPPASTALPPTCSNAGQVTNLACTVSVTDLAARPHIPGNVPSHRRPAVCGRGQGGAGLPAQRHDITCRRGVLSRGGGVGGASCDGDTDTVVQCTTVN
jgi:hypothetical protein